jgi:hypothetical protein
MRLLRLFHFSTPTSPFLGRTTPPPGLLKQTHAQWSDGPGTVMRLVIDVGELDGADVSAGFASAYFSTTGPANKDDILVADLASGTSTADLAPALKSYSGEFYVLGE